MKHRMAIAVLALVNALVALYLHLYKLGKVGALACSAGGGCQVAQFSQYGWFLGLDVALIGAVGYAFMFLCALVALQPFGEVHFVGKHGTVSRQIVLPAEAIEKLRDTTDFEHRMESAGVTAEEAEARADSIAASMEGMGDSISREVEAKVKEALKRVEAEKARAEQGQPAPTTVTP